MTRKILFLLAGGLLAACCGMAAGDDGRVEAVGRGIGAPETAREQALAAALRDAVRQGAGVDVASETKVQNFQLEYDRVLTSSFGYIEEYKVVSQGYEPGKQTYTVKVSAKVAKGRPQMDNVMALRLLVKRMQSPRVMIECSEKIVGENLKGDEAMAAAILEEMAQKTGFELFRKSEVVKRDDREAARAALLGDDLEAKVKKAGIASDADFRIIAKVNGQVGPLREPFPDVKVRDASLGVDLQAVWADTGEVVATVSMPTAFFKGESKMDLPFTMPQQLVRYYLNQMLTGDEAAFKDNNGWTIYRRILARWITELDLGAKMQLEFRKISKADIDKLLTDLPHTAGVSSVWLREFDSRLFSTVEIETRLDSRQVADVVLKLLKGSYTLDASTKRRLRFVPAK